ncbi:lasso peptide biosynthesis PqqD family chaperone [Billgrantia ethanolica]|uniref:Lasso peptide biosynthesis PqqD family chaperone n=1 Tax=Billgrantia ethanolica TaxID=2733486 RepID=A0ABS9A0S9_9GAMM|nr:lasso peptide biosynthesis PqqD family chaperone [Halomonas ethanolica]MCE8002433.1 lasso peptide biosynthesis PqqD family chaperone [Halomonas ethanolica]
MQMNTVVKRHPSLLASQVNDDVVLFSAERGMYYGTQAVGGRIWSLIQDEMSVSDICDQLLAEFSVERENCERDVLQFLEQLETEGLVKTS